MSRIHNSKYLDKINQSVGKVFNSWKILNLEDNTNKLPYFWRVKAKCLKCGKIYSVEARTIINGLSKQCVFCAHNTQTITNNKIYNSWRKYRQKQMLCSEWMDNYPSFERWMLENKYIPGKTKLKTKKNQLVSPNNTIVVNG